MSKHYESDPNLVKDIAKNTERIEKEYRAKQSKKRQNKLEKEDLSQRWIAPLLLVVTLVVGFLVAMIF